MAKRRKKRRGSYRLLGIKKRWWRLLLQLGLRFFIPQEIQSRRGWLWFGVSRVGTGLATVFVGLTLIFAIFPVPFSAYMAQKKVESWVTGQSYPLKYQWVSLDRVSWQMQMAVIASEDQNFDHHIGIDWGAIETALRLNAHSTKVRGASTISQQTVKNLYLWHGTSWVRKGIELPLTLMVEKVWDKSRILEIYLNIAEFGEGIFGVEAAAQHYFHKSAQALNLQEAALLAASLPNPKIYSVARPNVIMKKRQKWIIQQISNLGGQRYLEKL